MPHESASQDVEAGASALQAVWKRMQAVTRVDVAAYDGGGGARTGRGCVEVSRPVETLLRWTSRGRWQQGDQPALRFRSAYEWRCVGAGLHLAHLRRGSTHPVALVELHWSEERQAFVSAVPHRCRADRYVAQLCVDGTRLRLQWRVTGPGKDMNLHFSYY